MGDILKTLSGWVGEILALVLTYFLFKKEKKIAETKSTSETRKIDVDANKSIMDQLNDAWDRMAKMRELQEAQAKEIHDCRKKLISLERRLNRYRIFDTLIENPPT